MRAVRVWHTSWKCMAPYRLFQPRLTGLNVFVSACYEYVIIETVFNRATVGRIIVTSACMAWNMIYLTCMANVVYFVSRSYNNSSAVIQWWHRVTTTTKSSVCSLASGWIFNCEGVDAGRRTSYRPIPTKWNIKVFTNTADRWQLDR